MSCRIKSASTFQANTFTCGMTHQPDGDTAAQALASEPA